MPAATDDDVTAQASATLPGATAADAVPWENVETFLAATRGRYEKVDEVVSGPERATLVEETSQFDLDARYVEVTLEFPDAGLLSDGEMTGDESLRFITTDTTMLMWNGTSAETCGAAWVDMTTTAGSGGLGLDLAAGDGLLIEPFEVLRLAGEPALDGIEPDGATWYEFTAPAGLGMQLSSDLANNPAVLEAMDGMESPARVLLPTSGTTFRLEIDHSEVAAAASRAAADGEPIPEGMAVTSVWHVTTDIPPFDTALPTDVAPPRAVWADEHAHRRGRPECRAGQDRRRDRGVVRRCRRRDGTGRDGPRRGLDRDAHLRPRRPALTAPPAAGAPAGPRGDGVGARRDRRRPRDAARPDLPVRGRRGGRRQAAAELAARRGRRARDRLLEARRRRARRRLTGRAGPASLSP